MLRENISLPLPVYASNMNQPFDLSYLRMSCVYVAVDGQDVFARNNLFLEEKQSKD